MTFSRMGWAAAALLALSGSPAAAAGGEQLWRFYAEFAVTTVVSLEDISGNGGLDLLVGSADDTLYLVEGRGPNAGKQLWQKGFRATLSAAAPTGDLNGDGRADVLGGDQEGNMQAISGASGTAIWGAITFGTVLSILSIPDVNGDGIAEAVFGSENDTVYCMSSKAKGLGVVEWKFGIPASKKGPPGDGGPVSPRELLKAAAGGKPIDVPSGANSLALLRNGSGPFGVAVGTNNDTVYALNPANGTIKWKSGLPGDIWKIAAFPDQDGDGIEEVLLACGANAGYLLKGSDGSVLWSHAVTLGGVSVAVSPDCDGDGKHDGLIGDGGGKIHCVSGKALGSAPAAWTYDFGDGSTVESLVSLGDLDGDGRSETAAGTSNDMAAVISGNGTKAWSVNMGGTVSAVASLGDFDGNGAADVAAGTHTGYVSLFSGGGIPVISVGGSARGGLCLARCRALGDRPGDVTWEIRLDRPASAALEIYDGRGRLVARPLSGRLPSGTRRVRWSGASAGAYAARLVIDGRTAATEAVPAASR